MSSSRLIIRNLPKTCGEKDVINHLRTLLKSTCGLTDCKIIRKTGSDTSRMFGYLGFKSEADAETVRKAVHNTYLQTRKIDAQPAFPQGDKNIPRPWSQITEDKKGGKGGKKGENGATEEEDIKTDDLTWLKKKSNKQQHKEVSKETAKKTAKETGKEKTRRKQKDDEDDSGRIRLINIPYDCEEREIREFLTEKVGEVAEIHMPKSSDDTNKGYSFVSFVYPESAVRAVSELDGTLFQGRALKVEFAREWRVEDAEESLKRKVMGVKGKHLLSAVKKDLIKKQLDRSKSEKSWNLLYTSGAVAVDVMADQLGLNKDDMLNLFEASDSLAARTALAESLVVNQVKQWLKQIGLGLSAFERKGASLLASKHDLTRSETMLIVKHLSPVSADAEELKDLFAKYGKVVKCSLAPTRTVAVVDFYNGKDAKKAFEGLLLSKYHDFPLYLEWAPLSQPDDDEERETGDVETPATAETREQDDVVDASQVAEDQDLGEESTTLFVTNLSFDVSEDALSELMGKMEGCRSVMLMMKKRKVRDEVTGEMKEKKTSMGHAFVEYDTYEHATAALKRYSGFVLQGHAMHLAYSNKKSTRKVSAGKRDQKGAEGAASVATTKRLIVKNLPFNASVKDIKQLFSVYCTVQSVRMPKKADGSIRGFAFISFPTKADAQKALDNLSEVHLLGRHLILQPTDDAE